MPMKEQEFKQWLVESGMQESTARSRVANVKKIEDVYPDLDSRIDDSTIINLLSVFNYTNDDRKNNREPLHKIAIDGDIYNGTATYKSALNLYVRFRNETENQVSPLHYEEKETPDKTKHEHIASDKLYKASEFKQWMLDEENMSTGSANCYLSFLNSINNYIDAESNSNVHFLLTLSNYLKNNQTAVALDLIEKVEIFLTRKMLSSSTTPAERKKCSDYRSGLRKYRLFIEDSLDDIPDAEEMQEAVDEVVIDSVKTDCDTFTYEDLESNFRFRLMTQNRMSNKKDIFYPIGIIRKLFRYSQRRSKNHGPVNSDYDWFKLWINDYVSEIKVETEDGSWPLCKFSELSLSPTKKWVKVNSLDDAKEHTVYTETDVAGSKAIQMNVSCLRDIHIDHTPLMTDVLTKNADHLPALANLSEIIKSMAGKAKINIQPSNFGKISKSLFSKESLIVDNLLPLIPELKKELNFLRGECTLKLMQASYNLRKK